MSMLLGKTTGIQGFCSRLYSVVYIALCMSMLLGKTTGIQGFCRIYYKVDYIV